MVVEGGGREVSQPYQRDRPSALIVGSQRHSGGKGRVDGEQHPSREKIGRKERREKKAMFIPRRLHQMTAAFYSSVHN